MPWVGRRDLGEGVGGGVVDIGAAVVGPEEVGGAVVGGAGVAVAGVAVAAAGVDVAGGRVAGAVVACAVAAGDLSGRRTNGGWRTGESWNDADALGSDRLAPSIDWVTRSSD